MKTEEYKQLLKKVHVNPLCDLKPGYTDVYCVVKKSFDFKQSAKGDMDWKVTLYIADPTYSDVGITVLMFHKDGHAHAKFKDNSIIVLKGVTVKSFNDKKQIIVNKNRKVALFLPGSEHAEKIDFLDCPLDGDDHTIVRYLQKWNTQTNHAELELSSRQFREVKEISERNTMFMDFIGQVVDIQKVAEDHLDLVLTDYTENSKPDSSLKERDNLNVGVKFLILCGLWDNNADDCPELIPGDFVSLTNCKLKAVRFYELNIHRETEGKIRVVKLKETDPRLENLLARKNKHRKTEEKKKREIQTFQSHALESRLLSEIDKTSAILGILNEREDNKSYQIYAYIKDYQPKNPKDWIRGWCSSCSISNSPGYPCTLCQQPTEFFYKFALLVNDGSGVDLMLYSFGNEALKLFPTINPEQAFNSANSLHQLEEIISLACNEDKQYLAIALRSYLVEGQNYFNYQIVDTQFSLLQ